jgi:antitoxin component of MazEF toxin-antitoxin module
VKWVQKLVKNGNSAQVTLPRLLLHNAGLVLGDFVELEHLGDGVCLIRKSVLTHTTRASRSPGAIPSSPLEGGR